MGNFIFGAVTATALSCDVLRFATVALTASIYVKLMTYGLRKRLLVHNL